MQIKHLGLVLALASAALPGCRDADRVEPPEVAETMPGLPLPPHARVLYRAGSADALQITFASELSAEQMVEFYRGVFSRGDWRLVSDARTNDGATALYAERDGPPLWVTIRPNQGAPGSRIDIAGGKYAKADSGKANGAVDSAARS